MGFPTVTVIIPTFNRAAWLPETVRSVLSQTVAPLEILIVDDGSTDDTEAVCGHFTEPVRYIRQDNAGVGAARNRGAAEARGEWLAFLDSDDLWTPDKLEVQLAALAATGADWSITGCVMMDLDGRTLRGTQGFQRAFPLFRDIALAPDEFFARHFAVGEVTAAGQSHRVYHGDAYVPLFHGNFASPATAMVRRQLFADSGGFDPSLRLAEETEFFHRLSARGPAVVVMSPLLRWRVGQAVSLISSTNTGSLIRNALLSLERAAELRAPWTTTPVKRIWPADDPCCTGSHAGNCQCWIPRAPARRCARRAGRVPGSPRVARSASGWSPGCLEACCGGSTP
jgi:glycosyltransferase involved in cell wall biosynthesis